MLATGTGSREPERASMSRVQAALLTHLTLSLLDYTEIGTVLSSTRMAALNISLNFIALKAR